jgi:hypothetical protein
MPRPTPSPTSTYRIAQIDSAIEKQAAQGETKGANSWPKKPVPASWMSGGRRRELAVHFQPTAARAKCPIGDARPKVRIGTERVPQTLSRCAVDPVLSERTAAEQNVFPRVTNVPLITDVAGSFWAFLDFSIVLGSHQKPLNVSDFSAFFLVLPDRIELSTSPLPRERLIYAAYFASTLYRTDRR